MIEGVRQRLLDAVRVRLRADVPVGIYLNGGIDSPAIAGMVVHLVREDVAQRTADFLGVKLSPVHVTEEALAARFEGAVWHSEALMPDVNGAGKLAMAEAAHEAGFKVMITGEGSDEHFAGYSQFQTEFQLELESWNYTPQKHELAIRETPAKQIAGLKWVVPPTLASTRKTLNKTTIAGLFTRDRPLSYAPWAMEKEKLNTSDAQTVFVDSLDGETRQNMMQSWHPLHTSEYVWTKTTFANSLLRYLGDNIDMAYQIESRPAFLDHHLTEYSNSLPPALKPKYDYRTGKFREKHILREAVKPFVTEEIYRRTKQPFLAPMRYRVEGAMHRELKELVTKENVEEPGFVDWEKTSGQVSKAIEEGDPLAFRAAITVAQYVVLSRIFGVKTAIPPVVTHSHLI
ncbi:hypothetical protein BDW67DRAFT_188159 [Aspergillus spinulosporus]